MERTFAWLHTCVGGASARPDPRRQVPARYERDDALHVAFMLLGCAVVCQRRLSAD